MVMYIISYTGTQCGASSVTARGGALLRQTDCNTHATLQWYPQHPCRVGAGAGGH